MPGGSFTGFTYLSGLLHSLRRTPYEEVSVKRSNVLMMLVAVAVLMGGCAREEAATGSQQETATIARPEPMPGELGTDAMTQTVELVDGRSENEGGILTEGGGPDDVTATSTTQTTTAATATTTNVTPPRQP